jgi:hypothetical protein
VKYLNQFGLTLFQSNIANTLKTTASKYIMPDKIRRKGEHCRYKISRRGVQYLSAVIKPKANA